jgi:hypothetical protein
MTRLVDFGNLITDFRHFHFISISWLKFFLLGPFPQKQEEICILAHAFYIKPRITYKPI